MTYKATWFFISNYNFYSCRKMYFCYSIYCSSQLTTILSERIANYNVVCGGHTRHNPQCNLHSTQIYAWVSLWIQLNMCGSQYEDSWRGPLEKNHGWNDFKRKFNIRIHIIVQLPNVYCFGSLHSVSDLQHFLKKFNSPITSQQQAVLTVLEFGCFQLCIV